MKTEEYKLNAHKLASTIAEIMRSKEMVEWTFYLNLPSGELYKFNMKKTDIYNL
jgi:hypothetical protein